MKLVRYSDHGEWAALYVDGKLERVGDAYLIDERIAQLANVEDREGDFTRGTNDYDGVPKTLEELEEFLNEAESAAVAQEEAQTLQQIEHLEREAQRLRDTLK